MRTFMFLKTEFKTRQIFRAAFRVALFFFTKLLQNKTPAFAGA